MECNFPLCTRKAEANGLCIFHRHHSDSVEIKLSKPIPKESEKEKALKKPRKQRYKEFLARHPFCMAKFSKQCAGVASVIHHLKGRSPKVVDDDKLWLACCPICNGEIEARHLDAEKQGLKIPQHRKPDSTINIGAHSLSHLCGITPIGVTKASENEVIAYAFTFNKRSVKGLLDQVIDNPGKQYFITLKGSHRSASEIEKQAKLFAGFLHLTNCTLPAGFIDALIK